MSDLPAKARSARHTTRGDTGHLILGEHSVPQIEAIRAISLEDRPCWASHGLTAAIPVENPYCSSCKLTHGLQLQSLWTIPTAAVS